MRNREKSREIARNREKSREIARNREKSREIARNREKSDGKNPESGKTIGNRHDRSSMLRCA